MPQSSPELSPLHIKLRIQKDRLVAWGVQWADRSVATKGGDIDGSLDRAGLTDLVASIMSSIKDLLVEAESLQPMPAPLDMSSKASGKEALLASDNPQPGQWSRINLRRLEEIIRDLTTSIDTLCDLSRPRLEKDKPSSPSKPSKFEAMKAPAIRPISMDAGGDRNRSPARRDDLTDMAYIDPSMLRVRASHSRTTSSPPSYESVATGSENRVLAYFSLPSAQPNAEHLVHGNCNSTAVLLDYRQASMSKSMPRPDSPRFQELLLAILKFSTWEANSYTGILKLNGWTVDRQKSRFAYVYEIPRPIGLEEGQVSELQPRSLLSFLQNGSDADASNVPCLENRFRLALNLCLSLMRLHEMNVTHRNVNSNNVLFFIEPKQPNRNERVWKGPIIRKPYLTGLHQLATSIGTFERDSSSSSIYYHPSLAGPTPSAYELVHDYYSLGLILLEIGLWMPIGKFWKSKYTIDDFKSRLQDIYLRKLSGKCGETYMRAVLFCLTAAETIDSSADSEHGLEQERQAARFQHHVIRPLERCCLMDGELRSDEIIDSFAEEPIAEQHFGSLESSVPQDPQPVPDTDLEATQITETIAAPAQAPQQTKIKVWSHEIPSLYSQYWTSTMFPKFEKILRKALDRWESYTIDIFMAGEHPDTARPTIYVECASTAKVRKILRHLNKELRLFEIKVVPGQISRSKANKKKKAKKAQPGASSGGVEDLNPCYQAKPGFGASIGAYLDGNHLPPVTFGGAVMIEGQPYGMSVHHMLEDDEEMQLALGDGIDMHRSMAPREAETDVPVSISSLQEQISALYPFEVSSPGPAADDASSVGFTCSDMSASDCSAASALPEAVYPFELDAEDDSYIGHMPQRDNEGAFDDDEFWLQHDFDDASTVSDDEEFDMGDTEGITPGNGSSLLVTQPAIDDVKDGFFPCPEDADSEHLSSHTLGYIHASSGLRRTRSDELIHEVDWALIKIHSPRLPASTSLNKPPTSPTGFLCPRPTQILPSESLASRAVHSHARSSGLFAQGTILPAMRLVRMPGRVSPSHSWQVKGNFGSGGDSGAWVFDDATGAVCGHVLAYSERSQVAYIAPMDVMVRDMERVLGKEVRLPGVEASVALSVAPQSTEQLQIESESGQQLAHDHSGKLKARSVSEGRLMMASPVVPTSPPVLPRYDSGTSREAPKVDAKSGRTSRSPLQHGTRVQAG